MQRIASFGAGTFANRPTPETTSGTLDWTGVTYLSTDTQQLFRWSGTGWVDISADIPPSTVTTVATALETSGASVDVSGATPPTTNQILAASNPTHAVWITPTLTGGTDVSIAGTWPAWTVNFNASASFIGLVASVDLLGQGAAIGATTLYAVPTSGLYRVTIDGVCTSAGTITAGVTPKITWDNGSIASPQLVSLNFISTDVIGDENILVGGDVPNAITIYCNTGTNIKYSTVATNPGNLGTYALHMRVEFLG
jgi:hypothetical protein